MGLWSKDKQEDGPITQPITLGPPSQKAPWRERFEALRLEIQEHGRQIDEEVDLAIVKPAIERAKDDEIARLRQLVARLTQPHSFQVLVQMRDGVIAEVPVVSARQAPNGLDHDAVEHPAS